MRNTQFAGHGYEEGAISCDGYVAGRQPVLGLSKGQRARGEHDGKVELFLWMHASLVTLAAGALAGFAARLAFRREQSVGMAAQRLDEVHSSKAQHTPILIERNLLDGLEAELPDGLPASVARDVAVVAAGGLL